MKNNHSRRHRRTDTEIIAEILETANGGVSLSELILKANLSTSRLDNYTEMLVEKLLLVRLERGAGAKGKKHKIYMTSDNGMEFLSTLNSLKDMLQGIDRPLNK